jgi:predicted N-acetyltransferase YhbS
MIVRPEASADYEAISRVVTDAFGDPGIAALVKRLRASDRYRAELAHSSPRRAVRSSAT